jgi:hypothetical protein
LDILATHVRAAEVAHANLVDYVRPVGAAPPAMRPIASRVRASRFSETQAALASIRGDHPRDMLLAYLCMEMLDANTRFYAEEGLAPEIVSTPGDIAVATRCYQQVARACAELQTDRALVLTVLQQPVHIPEQPSPEQASGVQLPEWKDGPFRRAHFLGLLPQPFRPLTSELLAADVRQPQLALPQGMAEAWNQALTTLRRRAARSYENLNAIKDLEFDLQRLAPGYMSAARS